jgi:hypothetical protein
MGIIQTLTDDTCKYKLSVSVRHQMRSKKKEGIANERQRRGEMIDEHRCEVTTIYAF